MQPILKMGRMVRIYLAYRRRQAMLHHLPLRLWIETARACERLGIRRLDFGKGTERFKMQLMSGATPLAEGTVDSRPVAGSLWRGWLRTREWVRGSRLRGLARRIDGALNRPRAWLESVSAARGANDGKARRE